MNFLNRIRNSHLTQVVFMTVLIAASTTQMFGQTSIFKIQNSPSPNVQGNTLNAVAATFTTDAWAVGYQNDNNLNESRTLTIHWNGTAWSTVASPNPGTTPGCNNSNTGNVLNAVATVASNDVWAVGFAFTCISANLKPIALHWDGTKWTSVRTPALRTTGNSSLNGIVAFASNNIFAVGYQPAANGAVLTLIEHWDGSKWSLVSSPNINNTGNTLFSISATSPSDIWTVGVSVSPSTPVLTLALHFDGIKWSIVPTPNPLPTGNLNQNTLLSVKAVSANDVTAVGFLLSTNSLNTTTLIEHWDGTKWSVVPSPNQSTAVGAFNTLKAVDAVSGSNIYAVGYFADSATVGQQNTMVQHWDGVSWSIIPSPTKAMSQQVNGAFVLPGTSNVWAVGAFSIPGVDFEDGFLQLPKTLVLFSPIG